MKPILEFQGEHRWLSNFWPCSVYKYPSVEHAFQAMKTLNQAQREQIRAAATPGIAKRLGRTVTLRADWEEIKDQAMLECLRTKFKIPNMRILLKATGDAYIEEGNRWNDRYWGISPVGSGQGKNKLGILLMQVRKEIS